jgi:hypothetical protein
VSYALANARVNWNDPSGDWKLLVMEDLGRSAPLAPSALKAGLVGVLTLLPGWLLVHLLRGRHAQVQANAQLQAYSRQQEVTVAYRAKVASIALRLQRCSNVGELAHTFLSNAREALGAQQGVIYIQESDSSQEMTLAASSASSSGVPATLLPGEDLLGQCALEGRTQVIAVTQDGFWKLRSGLGNVLPAALFIAPIVLQERSLGLIELGLQHSPGPTELQHFEELLSLLAMNLEILRRNVRSPLSHQPSEALEIAE